MIWSAIGLSSVAVAEAVPCMRDGLKLLFRDPIVKGPYNLIGLYQADRRHSNTDTKHPFFKDNEGVQ